MSINKNSRGELGVPCLGIMVFNGHYGSWPMYDGQWRRRRQVLNKAAEEGLPDIIKEKI